MLDGKVKASIIENVKVPKNINTKSKWTREREGGKARGEIETEEKKREQEKRKRDRKINRVSKMETKGNTERKNAFSEDKKMYL